MARKKKSTVGEQRLEEVQNTVSIQKEIIEDIIKPAVEDQLRDKVLSLRVKGYNSNQIAAMLMIHKHKVDEIK